MGIFDKLRGKKETKPTDPKPADAKNAKQTDPKKGAQAGHDHDHAHDGHDHGHKH